MLHLQRPTAAGGRGLSAQTALQRFQSVRQFFKFLEDVGNIKESPMLKLKPPRVPEKLVPVIADDDMRKLFRRWPGATSNLGATKPFCRCLLIPASVSRNWPQ